MRRFNIHRNPIKFDTLPVFRIPAFPKYILI